MIEEVLVHNKNFDSLRLVFASVSFDSLGLATSNEQVQDTPNVFHNLKPITKE
eukprot:Pgem_evm1s7259